MMKLCHKCGGVLEGDRQDVLYPCFCVSGYVRGFEPDVTFDQAREEQRNAVKQELALYRMQGRKEDARIVQDALTRQGRLKAG